MSSQQKSELPIEDFISRDNTEGTMLQDAFVKVYTKFKLHFYTKFFERIQERETSLTTVETFCMEIIYSINNFIICV